MCALTKRPSEDEPVLQQYGHSVLQQQQQQHKSSNTIVLMHFSKTHLMSKCPFREIWNTHHHPFPFHVFLYIIYFFFMVSTTDITGICTFEIIGVFFFVLL